MGWTPPSIGLYAPPLPSEEALLHSNSFLAPWEIFLGGWEREGVSLPSVFGRKPGNVLSALRSHSQTRVHRLQRMAGASRVSDKSLVPVTLFKLRRAGWWLWMTSEFSSVGSASNWPLEVGPRLTSYCFFYTGWLLPSFSLLTFFFSFLTFFFIVTFSVLLLKFISLPAIRTLLVEPLTKFWVLSRKCINHFKSVKEDKAEEPNGWLALGWGSGMVVGGHISCCPAVIPVKQVHTSPCNWLMLSIRRTPCITNAEQSQNSKSCFVILLHKLFKKKS